MGPHETHLYPVFLDLKGKSVLLVGGGAVAFRKAGTLLESGCRLTVVAKHTAPLFKEWLEENAVAYSERPYRDGEAEGYFLVISATDDPQVNRKIYEDANRADCLINVVDQPHLCNLYVPSVLRRGALQLAISTSGKCPALARKLRLTLDKTLPQAYGPLLKSLSEIRKHLMESVSSPEERKQALEEILTSHTVGRFLEGDGDIKEEVLQEKIMEEWKKGRSD